ncbi:MAG: CsgG/HfaB family protein [Woeseiaceae bacterium]|nr:CsgG/HfaB family protein [Woeseiaceae bacterium]
MKKLLPAMALILSGLPFVAVADVEEPTIPKCDQPYGTVALSEAAGGAWWQSYDLENPEALIKYYVTESGCFTLVDRGDGLQMGINERVLGQAGELAVGSNVGAGQLTAADFFLVPDLIADDEDKSGNQLAGAIGGKIGGGIGGILGKVETNKLEADTILSLVNSRSGVQAVTARATVEKRDMSFDVGGLLGVAGGIGSYQDTEIGRVIAAAYAHAYSELVAKIEASGGALADSGAPAEAYTIAYDTDMYKGPARADAVRFLREGMLVYPTGNRDGAFLEVNDKFGTLGWVSVEDLL